MFFSAASYACKLLREMLVSYLQYLMSGRVDAKREELIKLSKLLKSVTS